MKTFKLELNEFEVKELEDALDVAVEAYENKLHDYPEEYTEGEIAFMETAKDTACNISGRLLKFRIQGTDESK